MYDIVSMTDIAIINDIATMNDIVSQIYYKDISIQIYWDNLHQNVLVQNDGLWVILPNMTIQEVIRSLGFYNNDIVVTWAKKYNLNILDTLVSEAHQNTIAISSDCPSCIISDNCDTKKNSTDSNVENNSDEIYINGCFRFIKKFNFNIV